MIFRKFNPCLVRNILRKVQPYGSFRNLSTLSPVQIGFIGAGDIATLHAKAVNDSPQGNLVGLWNRENCPVVPDVQARCNEFNCNMYSSAEDLVSDPTIDAVYILTNLENHFQYAKLAMEAGKHVLIEKPVGNSVSEIEELDKIAKENNVHCVPGHNYIHEPQIHRIKDLITTGQLGDITQIYIMYNIHHPEDVCARMASVLRHILTHHSYINLFLIGEPVTVSAMDSVINDGSWHLNNVAHVSLKFKNDAIGHFQASFANDDHTSAPWTFMIKVLGTKGGCHYNYNDFIVNQKHIVHSHTYSSYPYALEAQTLYFTEKILQGGLEPLSSMQDAVVCQKIIEASELSIEERRHVDLAEI